MSRKITIAIEIADTRCAKELQEMLQSVPNAESVEWFNDSGEKGARAVKAIPDIIIVDDHPETSRTASERFVRLRQIYPHAAIFVVSETTRPEYIVEVMRAGVAHYLVRPVNSKILLDAVEEVRSSLATAGNATKGMVWSFLSSKGGLGSTVIAVNTAVAMTHKRDQNVALCDMSLQSGDASVLLDLVAPTTIDDLSRNFHRLDLALLRNAMSRHASGLDFLPAPIEPEDSEDITAEHISRILPLCRQAYDAIVVDCTSMRVDERTIEIFKASDKVFVVTDLSMTAVRNATRLCQLIERVGIPRQRLEVGVNRYSKGATLSIEEAEKSLKRRIYWLFPNEYDEVVSSINRGTPLVTWKPHVPFVKSIFEFAEKLGNPAADENYRGLRGTFGKAI